MQQTTLAAKLNFGELNIYIYFFSALCIWIHYLATFPDDSYPVTSNKTNRKQDTAKFLGVFLGAKLRLPLTNKRNSNRAINFAGMRAGASASSLFY